MPEDNARILAAVYAAVEAVNERLPPDQRLPARPDTVLFGEGGRLDSLSLVELIAEAEVRLEDALGRPVPLATDRALSAARSPFRSLGSLAEYAAGIAREGEDGTGGR